MKHSFPKIALINVTGKNWVFLEPPLGILSVADYVINKGHISRKNLLLLDVVLRDPIPILKYFKPDLVGISSFTLAFPDAIKLATRIKETFGIPVVIGGIHISARPDHIAPPFDLGVVGEGEETFAELIDLFSQDGCFRKDKLRKIKGLVFRKNDDDFEMTGQRAPITPLDKIPPPDWSLLPEIYFQHDLFRVDGQWKVLKQGTIFSARGCPFKCLFCGRHSVFQGVRFFSIKRTVDDIENLVKNYGVEAIHIYDDTFTISKERVKELISEMKKRNLLGKVVFPKVFGRADLVDKGFLKLLKELGAISVVYGFESGSDRILKYLKNDTVTVKENIRAIDLTEKFGMDIIGGFMFASPNETKQDMEKTLDLIKDLARRRNVIKISITRTTPFPGTKLWDYALKKGAIKDEVDWISTDLFCCNVKVPAPFFTEKISYKDYEKIWLEAKEICSKLWDEMEVQKRALGTTARLREISRYNNVMIPVQLLSREFRNDRYTAGTKWFADMLKEHMFSREKLQGDFRKLKVLTRSLT
ncbi:MAG: radical SAM protein [bacterium]|nr:radical SAM protein [bacterium]